VAPLGGLGNVKGFMRTKPLLNPCLHLPEFHHFLLTIGKYTKVWFTITFTAI
jgi:hypothetical protein